MAADPHRPAYHFLSEGNWLNDPNGLIQWQGNYHLFYQYNPYGPFHGTVHWGHAASADLVHWTHLPIALAPTPGGADQDGCWSGCAVDNNGVATFIYTGVRGKDQLPCIATSTDDMLVTWQKYPGNPVIKSRPPDLDLIGYRDHSVWHENGTWYQVIGAGIKDVGGTALLYRSPDLLTWEYLHPVLIGDKQARDPVWTGEMWECPDLFPLDGTHVLMMSVWNDHQLYYTAYVAGDFTEYRFTPQKHGIVDPGGSFYAPQTMLDDHGRRLIWGWLRENRTLEAQQAAGWSGCMSLPRVLSILPDGTLGQQPMPELQLLRGRHYAAAAMDLLPPLPERLDDMHGDTLEIIAEFDLGDATAVGINVRCSPDDEEQTRIVYDRRVQRLFIDRTYSSLTSDVGQDLFDSPLAVANGEVLRLHVFLDRSVVEVFAHGLCTTARIYPSRTDSLGVELFTKGGSAHVTRIDAWEMSSMWT
ncbi:MAG: glycoside hydrolase family 32 protein [Herpetosiphonaceae bacterium]|nr:glycoside hydrolase family 32 protein [Herpetosiphonaceae bacterium]